MTPSRQLCEKEDTLGPPSKKRNRDGFKEAMLLHLKEQAQERRRRREEELNEEHFGRHVAAVLKRLPNRVKATARHRIEQVLLDADFPERHAASDIPPTYSNFS